MRTKILFGILAFCLCCTIAPQAMAQHDGVEQDAVCRGVQLEAQEAVAAGQPFRNHGRMVDAAATIVRAAQAAGEIDDACASCIVHQFARRIPIADQEACGPDSPNPECEGATCATFLPCNEPNSCTQSICITTSDGLGVCVDGATSCGPLSLCFNGTADCPAGYVCAVNSCCGDPVCVPPSAFCVTGTTATSSAIPAGDGGRTIGSPGN